MMAQLPAMTDRTSGPFSEHARATSVFLADGLEGVGAGSRFLAFALGAAQRHILRRLMARNPDPIIIEHNHVQDSLQKSRP